MEELTEVITAAVFHPVKCNEFIYSSSKGTIRLCDMRENALCDEHAKCKFSVLCASICEVVCGRHIEEWKMQGEMPFSIKGVGKL